MIAKCTWTLRLQLLIALVGPGVNFQAHCQTFQHTAKNFRSTASNTGSTYFKRKLNTSSMNFTNLAYFTNMRAISVFDNHCWFWSYDQDLSVFSNQNAAFVGECAVFGKQCLLCRLLFLVPGPHWLAFFADALLLLQCMRACSQAS